jgi:HD superfamily phosphohydrolase
MAPPREKLIRDPVHDLIAFDLESAADRLLLRLIDSAEVQRLRRIRQIGMASLAFPGGEHSRFCHSLGVLHLARRMLALLSRGQAVPAEAALALQCAALLHDVGHGPYSHVVERFFDGRHEVWTRRIIESPETEVHQILSAADPALPGLVVRALDGTLQPLWLGQIVGSQLDADRFDYLLRDSLMTGVKYGVFDLERLLLLLRVAPSGDRLYVEPKGLLPIEKYLQSRYHMYRQVYFHKTVTAGEAMMTAVLLRARDLTRAGRPPGLEANSAFARILVGGGPLEVRDYLAFDDAMLQGWLARWAEGDDPVLADLSRRLRNRHLFKTMEIGNHDEQDLMVQVRLEQARELMDEIGLDPRYYLLFVESTDAPYRPYNPRGEGPGGTIWTEMPGATGVLCDVKDVSPTIRAFTESPYSLWRLVFPASHGGRDLRPALADLFRG